MERLKQGQVNDMALKFNIKGLTNELLKNLEVELNSALKNWKDEVYNNLRYGEFKSNADVDFEIERQSNIIIAYLKANTYVLADSYGTGSLMLTNNPGYQAYRNSERWNPARRNNAITGRPEGEYVDAFGNKKYSWGALEGRNIEGMEFRAASGHVLKVEPVSPSKALEIAEKWLYQTYLPRAYKLAVEKTNFSKYLVES